jgi:VanZ family protein
MAIAALHIILKARLLTAMGQALIKRNFAIVTAIIITVIIYGSLYPFEFGMPETALGPVPALLATWANKPGRGDFLSNILLYVPLGYFAVLAFGDGISRRRRLISAVFIGAGLSLTMELAQYYDAGRDSTLTDFYSNAIGTALGAALGTLIGGRFHSPLLRPLAENREATLLLAGWLGYRLFPYVPTIDLHKYWDALKPIVLYPMLSTYDLCRHTGTWLVVYALFATVFRQRRPTLLIPLFVGTVFIAEILIVGKALSVAEIAGAGLAFCLWLLLGLSAPFRLVVVTLLFTAVVIAQRLEPFAFSELAGHFGWIPFYSFMQGSIGVDVQSFFEKFFVYGSLIWLLVQVGWRLGVAAAFVCLLLLLTSWIEIYLPGRSAEITDAAMALAIAVIAELSKRSDPRPLTVA